MGTGSVWSILTLCSLCTKEVHVYLYRLFTRLIMFKVYFKLGGILAGKTIQLNDLGTIL